MTAEENTDRTGALVVAAKSGDRSALEQIYGVYVERLTAYISGRLPDRVKRTYDTEDLVQSTMVRALNNLGRFADQGPGSFHRWVLTILMNRLRSRVREADAQKRDPELASTASSDDRSAPSEADVAIQAEGLARLLESVTDLPPAEFLLIQWRFREGRTFDEMAAELGHSVSKVRRDVLRVVDKLRRANT